MAAAFWSLTSAEVGHGRVRGGMEWFRGEVQWVGARRIELRRRGFAGATSGGGFARCCSLELNLAPHERKKGERLNWTGSFQASAEEKSGAQM